MTLTPAATLARMASVPEWLRVPSPRFWIRCGSSTNGASPSHGHALGPHRRRGQALHPLVTGLEVHDPVAAHAAADQRADRGRRWSGCAGSRCRTRAGAVAPPRRATTSSGAPGASTAPGRARAVDQDGGHRLRVELADGRDQRAAAEITLARDRAPRCRASCRMLRSCVSTKGRFSSMTTTWSTEAAKSTTVLVTSGIGHPELEDAQAARLELVQADPEVGQGLDHVEVGLARAHDAEAAPVGPPTTRSRPWRSREVLGGRQPFDRDERLLVGDCVRPDRSAAARGARDGPRDRGPGRPADRTGRGPTSTLPDPVGHRGDDLEPDPAPGESGRGGTRGSRGR